MPLQIEAHGPPHEIAPGLFMALPTRALVVAVELDGAVCDLVLELNRTPFGVRPTAVHVTAQDAAITGTTLRSLRLWELTREVLIHAVHRGKITTSASGFTQYALKEGALTEDQLASLRSRGPNDESLEWVAYYYNLGDVLGLPPAKQVEANLGLSSATATRWIKRARDKGLLGPPDTGAPLAAQPPLTPDEAETLLLQHVDRETGEFRA